MALLIKLTTFFLFSFLIFTLVRSEHPSIPRKSRARAFIEFECKTTRYHDLCVRSLSYYYVNNFTSTPSHQQLAKIALRVALLKGESTQAYINSVAKQLKQTKGKDYRSIQECLNQINDGVDQLTNCIKENQKIKDDGSTVDFTWHASNMQTWMSTALTDSSMCVDVFSGRAFGWKTKAMIKAKVVNLEQQTSIALALFNRFAARYRSAHFKKPKV